MATFELYLLIGVAVACIALVFKYTFARDGMRKLGAWKLIAGFCAVVILWPAAAFFLVMELVGLLFSFLEFRGDRK